MRPHALLAGGELRRHQHPLVKLRRPLAFSAVWMLRAGAFMLLFLPILLVMLLSFGNEAFTTIPPRSYSLRWYWNIFERDEFVSSFLTSLSVAALVTPISVLLGTSSAYALWKYPGNSAR